ncbi:8232_t:CDS:1, partial [Gigaspora rosea]
KKRSTRSMKDTILIDLQENDLYTTDTYIKAISAVASVPSMQRYIERGN